MVTYHGLPDRGTHLQSVSTFLGLLELDPNKKFRLTPNDDESFQVPTTLPSLCSIGYLVKNHLDINSIPRLYFWELLGQFTDDENEKEKLDEFLTPEGTQDLWDYCNRQGRFSWGIQREFKD
jgi:sulfite reductase alpha subunit-like flavoprotein